MGKETNWKAIGIAAVIILVLSTVINIMVGMIYGLIVGFQTRGDSAAITEQTNSFLQSFPYMLIISLALGALVLWRGRVLAAKMSNQRAFLHIAIAVVAVIAVSFILGATSGAITMAALALQVGLQSVIGLLAGYFSTARSPKSV